MSRSEYLEKLHLGAFIWNKWRNDNPQILPDFKCSNLRGFNFHNYNLSDSSFEGSDLRDAIFRKSDLSNSDFRKAKMYRTVFSSSILKNTDLHDAKLYETVFSNIDLRLAKNLTTIYHVGPSVLDFRTLRYSKNLPISFLRGTGLPENVIKSIVEKDILKFDYLSCFISYTNNDYEFARKLYDDLQEKGVRCWFAPKNMAIGAKIRDSIENAILNHEKLIIILSKHTAASPWVEAEFETCFEKERAQRKQLLLPIKIDDLDNTSNAAWISNIKRTRNIGDFSGWENASFYKLALAQLLEDLKINTG